MRLTWFVAPAFLVASLGSVTAESSGQALSASPPPVAPGPVATPAGLPMPTSAQADAMLQSFARMQSEHQQLRTQTRERFLAALSPAHRNLVATLLGQLAVSPQPDPAGTARQLDAMLSPGERESILRVEATAQSQAAALAQQMQMQLMAALTAEQRAAFERQMAQARADVERRLSPEQRAELRRANGGSGMPLLAGTMPLVPGGPSQDAGSVLLRELSSPGSMPYGVMSSAHAGGGVLMQSVIASPPH